jgi:hypothetical protein
MMEKGQRDITCKRDQADSSDFERIVETKNDSPLLLQRRFQSVPRTDRPA